MHMVLMKQSYHVSTKDTVYDPNGHILRLPLSVLLTGQICCVVDGTLMTGNDG